MIVLETPKRDKTKRTFLISRFDFLFFHSGNQKVQLLSGGFASVRVNETAEK
jgi:hypothetical protein